MASRSTAWRMAWRTRRSSSGFTRVLRAVVAEVEDRPAEELVSLTCDVLAVVLCGDPAVLESPRLELRERRLAPLPREDAEDEPGQLRRPIEVVRVGRQDDLPAALPADESERARSHGLASEGISLLLDELARYDLRLSHGQNGDERHRGFRQGYPDRVPVGRGEASHLLRPPVPKLRRPLDVHEEIGPSGTDARVQQPGEGVDDVVRRHLPPVVKLDALPERERPGQPVAGGDPELSECRRDVERLVELDQTVEQLLANREAVDVTLARGIERGRVVGKRPAICAGRLRHPATLAVGRSRSEIWREPERSQDHPGDPHSTDLG